MNFKDLIQYLFPVAPKKPLTQEEATKVTESIEQEKKETEQQVQQIIAENKAEAPAPTVPALDPNAATKNPKSDASPKTSKSIFDRLGFPKSKPSVPVLESNTATTATSGYDEAMKVYEQGMVSIKDLIAPTSYTVSPSFIELSGMYVQSFYIYAYPRYINTNWLSPLINFEANIDISVYVYPMENERIMKTLRNKVGQMSSHIRMDQESGKARDPQLETALQDAEELRDKLARGEEKFFQVGIYFSVYHTDKVQLEKLVKQVQSILGGKLVLTRPAILRQEEALNTTFPHCQDEINITRNMNTSPLSSTFPFNSTDLSSDDGILYGLNRHNNSLIIFDRFKLANPNMVVFATSGAGKSYAVKLEILRSLMIGVDVIVIDPENEYEMLSQTVGGTYMRLSLNSDRRINPFDLPLPIRGYEEQPGDLLRSNIITIEGLVSIMMDGNISSEERSLLQKALVDTYSIRGITFETENPGAMTPPTMEDLYDVLSEMKGAESLAMRISQYTTGIYAGIFNKPTNVEMNNTLMVFCIRDLEESLRPTAMYVILNYIWNRVRSTLKKRMLVVDEAWTLMQHEDSAKFLYGIAKRSRKYFLGLTTITQDVDDFLKSKYGRPIVSNSAMQLLLKQSPSAVDELAEVFNLTDGEKYYLLNSGQGEGIFFAGEKHVAIQIIPSFSEDKIITTNPEEILAREKAAENFETK